MTELKSPRERYMHDRQFAALVNMMCAYIHQCHYTPSEMRDAAILASIIYEEQTIKTFQIPSGIAAAFKTLHEWAKKEREDKQTKRRSPMAEKRNDLTFAFEDRESPGDYFCVSCAAAKIRLELDHVILQRQSYPILCSFCGKIIAQGK